MHRPGMVGQMLEKIFVSAIIASRKQEIRIRRVSAQPCERCALVGPDQLYLYDFLPRKALSSGSASMASNIDTSSFASHSPNSGSAMR